MNLSLLFTLGIIFGSFVYIFYLLIRKKERMELLNRGVDVNIFYSEKKTTLPALRYGLLLVGLGAGILAGNYLNINAEDPEVGYFSMIFLFGGASLVISYFLEKREVAKNEEKEL